jgi:hypothetical protein
MHMHFSHRHYCTESNWQITAKFGGHLVPELGAARQSEAENYSALEPVD